VELLIMGKPNVGKTLLLINFAAYLGLREIRLEVRDSEGLCRTQRFSLERARRDLVSLRAPKTTGIQTLVIDTIIGRQRTSLVAIDTVGVAEGIPGDAMERHQLAVTLERLMTADFIFHVVDASAMGLRRLESPGPFDMALTEFGRHLSYYLVVANKMDRPGSNDGYRLMKERYRGVPITPVSAVTRRGFRDLKAWMMRVSSS